MAKSVNTPQICLFISFYNEQPNSFVVENRFTECGISKGLFYHASMLSCLSCFQSEFKFYVVVCGSVKYILNERIIPSETFKQTVNFT